MPTKKTHKAAAKDRRQGKSASMQAGEYVREEIERVRHGKHGARSPEQIIAIGLSQARRDGVKLPVKKSASKATRKQGARDEAAAHRRTKPSIKRSRASTSTLQKEGHRAASKSALSAHAKRSAAKRTAASRSAAAKKAARTKGASVRSKAAKKAARTRAANRKLAAT